MAAATGSRSAPFGKCVAGESNGNGEDSEFKLMLGPRPALMLTVTSRVAQKTDPRRPSTGLAGLTTREKATAAATANKRAATEAKLRSRDCCVCHHGSLFGRLATRTASHPAPAGPVPAFSQASD